METTNQVANTDLVEKIKEATEPETLMQKFGVDKNILFDVGVYGAIGFIVGFLLKKYSEYIIALAVLIVGLFLLQQFDYIFLSINVTKIQTMLGLENMPVDSTAFGVFLLEWMKINVIATSSLIIGFLIGLKVG